MNQRREFLVCILWGTESHNFSYDENRSISYTHTYANIVINRLQDNSSVNKVLYKCNEHSYCSNNIHDYYHGNDDAYDDNNIDNNN